MATLVSPQPLGSLNPATRMSASLPASAAGAPTSLAIATAGSIGRVDRTAFLLEVLRRTIRLLPVATGTKLLQLTTPAALAMLVGSIAVWVASHAVGIGEAVDILMLGVGLFFLGHEAVVVMRELGLFAGLVMRGKTSADMDEAARHLATAISTLGVDVVVTLLLRGGSKWVKNNTYKPKVTADPNAGAGSGGTNKYGDYSYSTQGTLADQELARYHEMVHSILSPRLDILRKQRADLRMAGYQRSQFLRYLEEAMAETYAQLRVNGFKGMPTGIKFPIVNAATYNVTVTGVLKEAALGAGVATIVVGGLYYAVTVVEEHL